MEYVIGIDVGKYNLDISVGSEVFQVSNDVKGHKKLLKQLKCYDFERISLIVCSSFKFE